MHINLPIKSYVIIGFSISNLHAILSAHPSFLSFIWIKNIHINKKYAWVKYAWFWLFQILKMLAFFIWCYYYLYSVWLKLREERLQSSWGMSQNMSSIYIEMYWWKLLVKNTNWLHKQNVSFSVRRIYKMFLCG